MGNFVKLINGNKPVLADFYASWCGPCKTLEPIIKEIKIKLENKVIVVKIDVDKNQVAASRFGIKGVPTLILFSEGKIVWRKSGVMSADQIINELSQFLPEISIQ